MTRGRRLNLPLAGRGLEVFTPRHGRLGGPNLRLELGPRIAIRLTEFVPARVSEATGQAGLDKGYRTF